MLEGGHGGGGALALCGSQMCADTRGGLEEPNLSSLIGINKAGGELATKKK